MKLQQLTIHNIASIEDAVIDFEATPLADSEVFLITGKTGAGKSTILDAICLALYDDTPRLDSTQMQGITTDGEKSIKVNDPKQLMRRNTGEAFVKLTFIGSNGIHYEATWSVARAHKKVTGNLQPKDWKLKNLDTDLMLTRDNEVKAEIKLAIGLDFKQFCRTTMLAQGEFTRFLNSKDDEKAEILEKITGVDAYSKIGARVFALTSEKEQRWKEAQQHVEGIITLTDEQIAEKKGQIAALEQQQQELKAGSHKAVAKCDWIKSEAELSIHLTNADEELRKATEMVESETFKAKEQRISEWNATIDARRWMVEADKAEQSQLSLQRQLEELNAELAKIEGESSLTKQEEKLKADEVELARINLPELRKKLENEKEQLNRITTAKDRIESLEIEKSRRTKQLEELQKQQSGIEQKREKLSQMITPLQKAEVRMNVHKEVLEKQKDTVHKFAQSLRLKLHVGDICPVCRQEIKSEMPHEEELALLVGELQKSFDDSEKDYKVLFEAKVKLEAEIKTDAAAFDRNSQRLQEDNPVERALRRATEACSLCGIATLEDSTLTTLQHQESAITGCKKTSERLIAEGETIESATKELRKAIDALRAKLLTLNEKITITKTKLTDALVAFDANTQLLEQFLNANPALNRERLTTLHAYTLNDISREDGELKKHREALVAKKTLLENARRLHQEHLQKRPDIDESETLESLTEQISGVERQLADFGEKKGAIIQELTADAESKQRLGRLIEEAKEKKSEYQKWSRLNQLIGDATGSKFRKIAQSYVLSSLIHSANSYMKSLTDRYTLKVTPGTFVIQLEDAYQGYTSRAASTISGGESFLVSLSLALALSDIGQTLSVDTLFIDEGFGTLSGEPLQNAIETLRSLHKKAGRHVGIISHVEELRERIPVQIRVNQEGNNSSSTIEIVP